MTNYYAACDFGVESGRVMLGTLHRDKLTIGEVRRFQNLPVREKDSLQWNIPGLYQEMLAGLREIGRYDEPLDGIGCTSWAADYLLFDADGSLITPTYHYDDPRTEAGMKEAFAKVPWETVYEETGVRSAPSNTLCQLAAERSKRLKRACHLLPVADGFNFLLGAVARVEQSLASATQLYNPVTRAWSDRLFHALRLPAKLFPPVVAAGTDLGPLRPEIARDTGLEDARVVASCSHETAAALVGLPLSPNENWAYMHLGPRAIMGTELAGPVINEASRELGFSNELGYGSSVRFSKHTVGLSILDECRRFWEEKDREIDSNLLMHLAISAPPFESLINPNDPRFLTPGDMPVKIQAFCKETGQSVPRKHGPIIRCVLESLALLYRRTLQEMEYLADREIARLYLLGESSNSLLNNFIANALRIPVVIAPVHATTIGNVMVQALALRHVKSFDDAREIVRNSFKTESIMPHTAAWDAAYDRLAELITLGPARQIDHVSVEA